MYWALEGSRFQYFAGSVIGQLGESEGHYIQVLDHTLCSNSNFADGARPAEERFATQSGARLLNRCRASATITDSSAYYYYY